MKNSNHLLFYAVGPVLGFGLAVLGTNDSHPAFSAAWLVAATGFAAGTPAMQVVLQRSPRFARRPILRTLAAISYVLLSLLGMCAAAVGALALYLSSSFGSSQFDAAAWAAAPSSQAESTCYRGGMANNILERVLKPDMTRQEVVSLLGTPDSSTPVELSYVLGMCSGLGFDYDNLHVHFDEHGRFKNAVIRQH